MKRIYDFLQAWPNRRQLSAACCLPLLIMQLSSEAAEPPHYPDATKHPDSPLMLDWKSAGLKTEKINFEQLPKIQGEHAILSDVRDQAGKRVHQHAYLAYAKGRYWAMWSDGPGKPVKGLSPQQHRNVVPGHDQPGNRVSYSTSKDGIEWTAPQDLSGPTEDNGVRIARGFWHRDDELLALTSYWTGPGWKGIRLEASTWNDASQNWNDRKLLLDDSLNNFPPKKLPDGQFMMTRRNAQRQVSVMIGGVKAFNDWKIHPLAAYGEEGKPEEPYWYTLPDGKGLVGLIRDNARSGRLLRTFSIDNGKTWSPIKRTNFPDATSKFFVLRTSRGYYVMVSNSNPRRRDPLTLAVSKDGLVFNHLFYLIGGRHVDYPHIIENDNQLLIAFSGAKQTMEVMRVSLDHLDDLIRKSSAQD